MLPKRFSVATSVLFLAFAAVALPAYLFAEGEQYYHCVSRDGDVTVTNRHYDERAYRCTPFTDLNKAFKQAEMREKKAPTAAVSLRPEREALTTTESARLSAESARTSMEAARTAAEAAHLTAEAARLVLTPYFVIISPQRPGIMYRPYDHRYDRYWE